MSKKLAIQGHSTRGKEVIELLEMLGGKNIHKHDGGSNSYSYYISGNAILHDRLSIAEDDDFEIFTLQSFLEKYPFKVGDKAVYKDDNDIVVISEIKWDDTVGDIFYNVKIIDEDDCFLCPPEVLKPYKETNKELAIKGHPTRGNEVIEILKMMGGNSFNSLMENTRPNRVYYIGNNNAITWKDIYSDNSCLETEHFFTLEEFLEKYPFKVGDKVTLDNKLCTITWMCWECNKIYYYVQGTDHPMFQRKVEVNELKPYKETNMNENKFPSFEPMFKMNDELEYKIPDGYEITEVSKDTVFIKPIKPKYPKTYKECCEKINACPIVSVSYDSDEDMLYNDEVDLTLLTLRKLLICRNAYWKIAGEEMGLGKSWDPCDTKDKYILRRAKEEIRKGYSISSVLEFPTEEMRDAFYENFKDLIVECKKFL